ncbi:MAG TPA: hypothetical protein VNI77_01860 [Nitrososphaera sp.]|nr:hypothetical protein [Nitrososphaera sp.]
MKRTSVIALFTMAVSAVGCSPSALELIQLRPQKAENVYTLQDLLSLDTNLAKNIPPNADKILMLGGDSVIAALSLYEMEDIFWLDIYLYNGTGAPYYLDPEQFVLMDGSRMFFRRLEPHEAANIFADRVTNIPAYQPKYTYDVRTATTGYIHSYGYYSGYSTTTVTKKEDPYHALGYNIGAAIAASRNKKYMNMAGTIYSTGLVAGASIPSTTTGYGGIFWLKRLSYPQPLKLRLANTGYEVEFRLPQQY